MITSNKFPYNTVVKFNRQDLYRHKLLLLVLVKQNVHCESVCHLKDNSNILAIKTLF